MDKYVLVYDIGTTGLKTCIFKPNGVLAGKDYHPFHNYYPKNGYQEQEPEEWWRAICLSTRNLLQSLDISKDEILCISFSGHMVGCIPIDKKGDLLLEKVPIYADSRGSRQAESIINNIGGVDRLYEITGTGQSPDCYSVSKYLWIKEEMPHIFKKIYKFLNTKDYIIFKITGEITTDFSDASDMGLLDINKGIWSEEICKASGISKELLPDIHYSTDIIGKVSKDAAGKLNLKEGTPVVVGGGDVCCAATGAGVTKENIFYISIGSANWMGTYSEKVLLNNNTKNSVFFHTMPNKYLIHQFMLGGGICYQWMRDNFYDFEKDLVEKINFDIYEYMNYEVNKIKPGSENLIFLPYLRGNWSGYNNVNARGAFIGLNLGHKKSHMLRSVLEGVGFSLRVILEMLSKTNLKPEKIRIIGGGSKSNVLKSIIADICKVTILTTDLTQEAGSLGAAIVGLVGIGLLNNFEEADNFIKIKEETKPQTCNFKIYDEIYDCFKESYNSLIPTFNKMVKIK